MKNFFKDQQILGIIVGGVAVALWLALIIAGAASSANN